MSGVNSLYPLVLFFCLLGQQLRAMDGSGEHDAHKHSSKQKDIEVTRQKVSGLFQHKKISKDLLLHALLDTVVHDELVEFTQQLVILHSQLYPTVQLASAILPKAIEAKAFKNAECLVENNVGCQKKVLLCLASQVSRTKDEKTFGQQQAFFTWCVEHNADINAQDETSGDTPLIEMVRRKFHGDFASTHSTSIRSITIPLLHRKWFIHALLNHKADLTKKNNQQQTAKEVAHENRFLTIKSFLEQCESNSDFFNEENCKNFLMSSETE